MSDIATLGLRIDSSQAATGVTQRVLTRWDEDCVGELLHPTPIDWTQWHARNPKPVAEPIQLSRVRRDMMARRERKTMRR